MTEQDVNNTLHSFDVIKQYQASGQSFEDFFEENKDLVKMSILTSLSLSITHIQRTEYG